MINYLKYIKAEILKLPESELKCIFIGEIGEYINFWNKYSNDFSRNPLYHAITDAFEKHEFNFPTGEVISINWDVDCLYKIAISDLSIKHMKLYEFNALLQQDLCANEEDLINIEQEVQSIYNHKYEPILVINFKPIQCYLMFDGRHRYIEFKKFKQNELLPVYILDDELCFEYILWKNELLSYFILHNIGVINNVLNGEGTLDRMIAIAGLFD